MRDQILELIKSKPKQYVKIIQKDPLLKQWVKDNSLITSDRFVEMIYSAIFQVENKCPYGNTKKYDRISTGFVNCGPANKCKCTKDSISKEVSNTKTGWDQHKHNNVNNKRAATMLSKYGCLYNSQRSDIKHIWSKPKISNQAYEKLTNFDWLNNEYNIKQRSLVDIANELQVYYSTVGYYCRSFNFSIRQTTNYSLTELEITNYINSLGVNVTNNDWNILGTHELDIVCPNNIAIEVNGLYWHSYNPTDSKVENRTYHLTKTSKCQNLNLELLHITDYEWIHKNDIIKNLIRSKLGFNSRIFARNCTVLEVSKNIEREFLNQYHLQGFVPSIKSFGLYYHNELLMLVSIGKTRFSKEADYELLRVCTKNNVTVVGGLSKLLKQIKLQFANSKLISYCDYSKSYGNAYKKVGFTLVRNTEPGYFWTDGNNIISRYKSQKHNLNKWLISFDPNKSESENMFSAGYRRFWDCGNLVFLMQL